MAFQGIKNQGTDPLQLFLAIRQLRQQEEQTKQDQALARVKAMQEARAFAREDEKFRMDMAIKAADLQAKQQGNAPAVADAIENANAEFTPADLSIAGGGEESQAFGAIVAGFDPAGLQRGINAQAALDSALRPAVQSGRSVESLYGEAEAARRASARSRATEAATKDQDAEREDKFAQRRENRAAKRAEELERRDEERRLESEQRAREQGFWEQSDLIAERNSISKQLAEPTRLLNEGWNALEKFEEDGTAQQYLEIVQRWVRKVDEGATVREGDISLVRDFGASAFTNFITWVNGITDAEGKVAPESKEAIKSAFEQLLTESDRGTVEEWEDRIAYADEQNWTDRERSKAIPRITAVRRTYNRFASRRYGSVELPGAVTEEEKRIAERRLRRRLNVGRNSLKADEIVLELKRMALERSERGGF